MRSCRVVTLILVPFLFLGILALPTSGEISSGVEAKLKSSGDLIVTGTSTATGFEAQLGRLAIDSNLDLPDLGLLGTGNGDGTVNSTEADSYAKEAVESGVVNKAFAKGIIKLSFDDDDIPAVLDSISFTGAEGNISSGEAILITFQASFEVDFKEEDSAHKIVMELSFSNVSYDLNFEVPPDWDIEEVKGMKDSKITNRQEGSYVSGKGSGDGTPVVVQLRKQGDVCCIIIFIGAVIIAVVVGVMVQRIRKKKMRVADGEGGEGGGVESRSDKDEGPGVEKRIGQEERTFGKEYHSKDEREQSIEGSKNDTENEEE